MGDKLKILLADDHHMVRAGIRALIDVQDDMRVVAEASDGETAHRLARETDPDVAILDISMPILSGAEAAERIRQDRPNVKILVLTVHEDRGYLERLVKAGASGYVLKRAAVADLIQAIRVVARGDNYLDPAMTSLVIDSLGRHDPGGAALIETPSLSDREEEVLRLIAHGYTNREIAAQLDVSIKTVETHKARATEKLSLDSRAEIVAHAIRMGWMTEG